MFGKEYAEHLDILMASFGEINEKYKKKINKNNNFFVEKLKRLYVSMFGIPEIGFQIRSLYFEKLLSSNIFNKNQKLILDAGCGIGSHTFFLAKKFRYAKVIGGEIDKQKLKTCRILENELGVKNVTFINLDITKKQNMAKYDLIINIDVLEHINRYELALENFSNLLRKGGYLYIHVPQPNQKRIFSSLKNWHHENHANDGIIKSELEEKLKKLGFKIIVSIETFGFFGKLAWEINHLMLSRSFVLAGITFPFLFTLVKLDLLFKNKDGLGIAVFAQKK